MSTYTVCIMVRFLTAPPPESILLHNCTSVIGTQLFLAHLSSSKAVALDRSEDRDAHIYDVKNATTVLGGVRIAGGVTNCIFFSMLEIVFIFKSLYQVRNEGGTGWQYSRTQ